MVAIMRECLAIGRAVGVDADIDPEARMDMARKLGRVQDLDAAGHGGRQDAWKSTACSPARWKSRKKAGVAAPFTESLAGLARLRAESTGQYR